MVSLFKCYASIHRKQMILILKIIMIVISHQIKLQISTNCITDYEQFIQNIRKICRIENSVCNIGYHSCQQYRFRAKNPAFLLLKLPSCIEKYPVFVCISRFFMSQCCQLWDIDNYLWNARRVSISSSLQSSVST